MKKQWILGSFIALTGITHAQTWATGGGNLFSNPVAGTRVGMGTNAPSFRLDVNTFNSGIVDDGIRISNGGQNMRPSLYFHNPVGINQKIWALQSQNSPLGTRIAFNNITDGYSPMAIEAGGQVWIGTATMWSPNGQFHVSSDIQSVGIQADVVVANPFGIASYVVSTGGAGTISRAIHGNASGGNENRGGNSIATGGSITKGVDASASGGGDNRGGSFVASGTGMSTSRGVYGTGSGSGLQNMGGWFEANDMGTGAMAIGSDNYATGTGIAVAVRGNVYGGSASTPHYGGVFQSWDATNTRNVGVVGTGMGGSVYNIGVLGSANSTNPLNYPFAFTTSFPQTNVGVYGTACVPGVTSGVSNQWAGWFDNNVMINGTAFGPGFVVISDRRLKKDIQTIDNASSVIARLNPTTYYMKTENEYGMHFSDQKQYGFISQEVETVLPDLVTEVRKAAAVDPEGKEVAKAIDYKGLNYTGFIALLTKGMQEQQGLIERLENTNTIQQEQLAQQQKQIDELLRKTGATGINELNGETGFSMSQNIPNPFNGETRINYSLSEQTRTATLNVYDLSGKQITSFPLDTKGTSITVNSEKLAAGIYLYSIVTDGKIMDTKRMVVAEK